MAHAELLAAFERHLLRAVPRLLTQLDRDPDSPTFGCFDRHFWHYKMRDFASMVLQQGMLVLDTLYHHRFPGNPLYQEPVVLSWIDGALRFWAASQLPSGSFNEYYPYEEGFPPTAFSLFAVTLTLRRRGVPAGGEAVLRSVQKAADWLLKKTEHQALNQEAVALAALSLAAELPGVTLNRELLAQRLDDFFAQQSPEGWFPEYGGADTGYLSVLLDALSVYHELSGDSRAAAAMEKALRFISSLISVAGTTPVMTNSRNTDYIVPHGIVCMAESSPLAAEVVRTLFADVEKPGHFLQATDDRYLCHYVYQSCFRSLERFSRISTESETLPAGRGGDIFHPEAGIHIRHTAGSRSTYTAGRKGGVFYLYGRGGLLCADFGWRQKTAGNHLLVTHWQHADNKVVVGGDGDNVVVASEGSVTVHGQPVSGVLRHALLRLTSRLLGNRIIAFLKERLIFRAVDSGIRYHREVILQQDAITLRDTFYGKMLPAFEPCPAPPHSVRHVASAANFNREELLAAGAPQRTVLRTADSLVITTTVPLAGGGGGR